MPKLTTRNTKNTKLKSRNTKKNTDKSGHVPVVTVMPVQEKILLCKTGGGQSCKFINNE